MPNTLAKNLHRCFSKCKRPVVTESPRAPLVASDHERSTETGTTSILVKNFNSLYDFTSDSTSKSVSRSSHNFSSSEYSEDLLETTIPDFATIFASQRLFFSSPGRSNSIFKSPTESPPPPEEEETEKLLIGGIPISTFSPDPYTDFRRSMQEMVEARELLDVRSDWDYLHELLLCYLTLNPKHTHKFIIGAFADLLLSLMTTSTKSNGSSNSSGSDVVSGRCMVSRRLL
ncbi:transcription repressor OFP11-like [Macadamia integrifolia]|uniref:transcription repressor OFP11-like n=1 Tax=Macadamia integrifolia TaxID=60698 RepID=UPI001C4E3EE7|nr:transcription repressor OFP11-like [Macadamia integrifolia]